MKRNLKIFGLCLMVAIMASNQAKAQQLPQFSQYIFNGLHINPGYAGYKNQGYIQSTYRNQWVNLEGAPRTFTITADLSANEGMMGFGVSVLSDQIGPTRTTTGLLTYSYRIQTGKESFLAKYLFNCSSKIFSTIIFLRNCIPNSNKSLMKKYFIK